MTFIPSLPWAWGGATTVAPTAPTLTGLAPSSGPVGTVVTLTGTNLSAVTQVQLGVLSCAFSVLSATTIVATVPVGATTGTFAVTSPDGTATAGPFTVTTTPVSAPPTILSIAPTFGPAGTVVTVTGTNLSAVSLVTLGLVAAPFVIVSPTELSVTVPASAQSGAVFVQSADGVAVSSLFTVTRPAPTASSLTLRWVLDAFPAVQLQNNARVLLRDSRNAIVVRDVVDVETDRYVTPTAVSWQMLDGADVLLSGALAASGDGWRGEILLDPSTQFGAPPVLSVTATVGGATWTRDYPIILTER